MHISRRLVHAFTTPIVLGIIALAPLAVFAQSSPLGSPTTGTTGSCASSIANLGSFFQLIICLIDTFAVPLIFAIAFVVFLFGIYRYFIAGANNEEKRKEGQQLALYALIGFFLMFSIWGIVNLLLGTISFSNSARPCYPTFGGSTQSNCGSATVSPSASQNNILNTPNNTTIPANGLNNNIPGIP